MARRHGAEIEIDSELGVGTTVRLSFAALAGAAAVPDESTASRAAPTALRILVVDDDPILLKSLRDALEGDGHEIVTACGGQAGIDLFRAALNDREIFDAVMTDLGMPHIDGRQVAFQAKALARKHP